MKKEQCPVCSNWFSLKGGNYKRHVDSCNGVYITKEDRGKCVHCGERFDLSTKPKGWMANHSRWCKSNPKRDSYVSYSDSSVDAMNSPESIEKRAKSISNAHQEGRYIQKYENQKGKNGRTHTEDTKQKMKESALKSKHRRLKRNMIEYKGVMLDSSWELALAIRLDELGIIWVRPAPIPWFDDEGKKHNYFPDFYLEEYDVFLDPKSPFAYKVQEDKIKILKETYENIIFINSLEECENFHM